MERRTIGAMIEAVRDLLDVSLTPYFSDHQVADALNRSYAKWYVATAKEAEGAERERMELAPLIDEKPLRLAGRLALTDELNPRVFRKLAVMVDYSVCNQNRAASPLSFDAWRTAERDPWNGPTPQEPAYLERKNGLEILPTPASATLVYLIRPQPITVERIAEKTEVEYEVQELIIEMAAARLAIPQDNGGAYQALSAEYSKNEQ